MTGAGVVGRIIEVDKDGRVTVIPDPPCFQHAALGRNAAHLENLRPAIAEPPVANHQAFLAGRKLARHRFHAEGAAARHDDRGSCVVDRLQHARYLAHDALEPLRHVVEGAVRVHHGIFEQSLRIGFGQQGRHGFILYERYLEVETTAFAYHAPDLEAATHEFDQPGTDTETKAGASKAAGG